MNQEWCVRCEQLRDAEDGQVVMTHPGSGPSYSSGGEPPEFDWMCDFCIEEIEEQEAAYEPTEEELWEERERWEYDSQIDWRDQQYFDEPD